MSVSARPLVRVLTAVGLVPVLVLGTLLVTSAASAQRIRSDFWGMHDTDWQTPPTVGVGSANLTTAGTYWANIETSAGTYDYTRLDEQVAAAEARNAQPMVVLGQTPQFASTCSASAAYSTCMPDVAAWRAYVTDVATRYGARLDYQIWPEPNIVQNWTGTPREMAYLTMVASNTINNVVKDVHGDLAARRVKVVSPAVAVRLQSQRRWVAKYFKERVGGNPVHTYVDAIAIDPFPELRGTPEDSFRLMQSVRRTLANLRVRKPLWNNEINYGVEGAGDPTGVTLSVDLQQSYVIRTYVLSAAAQMQRTYWLGWFDSAESAVKMADSSGVALPPALSYSVVRSWLNRTRFSGCSQQRNGLWVCTAKLGRREVRRIYWHPSRRVLVTLPQSARRLENQEGGVDTTPPRRTRVTYRPVMVASRR